MENFSASATKALQAHTVRDGRWKARRPHPSAKMGASSWHHMESAAAKCPSMAPTASLVVTTDKWRSGNRKWMSKGLLTKSGIGCSVLTGEKRFVFLSSYCKNSCTTGTDRWSVYMFETNLLKLIFKGLDSMVLGYQLKLWVPAHFDFP